MPSTSSQGPTPSSIDLLDGLRLYDAAKYFTAGKGPQYPGVIEACARAREAKKCPAAETIMLFTASNPSKQSQEFWRTKVVAADDRIKNLDVPFWETGIHPPPQRVDDEENKATQKPIYTVSPLICYQLGLLASRKTPFVVIASNGFECAYPAADLVERAGARVIIVFFRSLMEPRWERSGLLFGPKPKLEFYDLEPHARSIVGIDIDRAMDGEGGASRKGISFV